MNSVLKLEIKNSNNSTAEWCKKMYPYPTETLIELLDDDSQIMRDAGFDVHCPDNIVVPAHSISYKIPLGIKIRCSMVSNSRTHGVSSKPSSIELWPRSSCGSKTPLRLANSIGLIDSGYRGELIAIVDNLGSTDVHINQGDRLFQLVAPGHSPIYHRVLEENEDLDTTERGEGGFGSTGA